MNPFTKKFIESHEALIEEGNWKELFRQWIKATNVIQYVGSLIDILYKADVYDPSTAKISIDDIIKIATHLDQALTMYVYTDINRVAKLSSFSVDDLKFVADKVLGLECYYIPEIAKEGFPFSSLYADDWLIFVPGTVDLPDIISDLENNAVVDLNEVKPSDFKEVIE